MLFSINIILWALAKIKPVVALTSEQKEGPSAHCRTLKDLKGETLAWE
jgi:hypothetical protein